MPTYNPTSFNTSVARPLSKKVSDLLKSPNPPQWAIVLAKRKAQQFNRWRVPGTPFLVGQKKVFLPKFTIALRRTPNLSPWWAQFEVPLSFNKLDIRDYLFHAYNVRIRSVRIFIPWQPVTRRYKRTKPGQRMWYRPRSIKKMTVELEKPFVWPEPPEDYTKWDHDRYKAMQKTVRSSDRGTPEGTRRKPMYYADKPDTPMREQAEKLLRGETKWKATDPSTIPESPESADLTIR